MLALAITGDPRQVFFNAHGTLIRGNHVARSGDDIVLDGGVSDTTVAHNLVTDALGCPFCDPPTGFGILVVEDANDNTIADNLVSRTKEDGIRVLDFDPADPVNPVPSGTVMRGNLVSHAGHDGIRTDSAAAVLTRNAAYFNHDLGIEAVPGATDGGGNRARHNGNPAECVGVTCH